MEIIANADEERRILSELQPDSFKKTGLSEALATLIATYLQLVVFDRLNFFIVVLTLWLFRRSFTW